MNTFQLGPEFILTALVNLGAVWILIKGARSDIDLAHSRLDELAKNISEYRERIATTFVTTNAVEQVERRLNIRLNEMIALLTQKG